MHKYYLKLKKMHKNKEASIAARLKELFFYELHKKAQKLQATFAQVLLKNAAYYLLYVFSISKII